MRELGWVYGQNIVTEPRAWGDQNKRIPDLAAELIRWGADIFTVAGGIDAMRVQQVTRTIPIVTRQAVDSLGTPGTSEVATMNHVGKLLGPDGGAPAPLHRNAPAPRRREATAAVGLYCAFVLRARTSTASPPKPAPMSRSADGAGTRRAVSRRSPETEYAPAGICSVTISVKDVGLAV